MSIVCLPQLEYGITEMSINNSDLSNDVSFWMCSSCQ